ncbi:hypothetical protein HPB47_007751, partial [Ixodes persulcatus]
LDPWRRRRRRRRAASPCGRSQHASVSRSIAELPAFGNTRRRHCGGRLEAGLVQWLQQRPRTRAA